MFPWERKKLITTKQQTVLDLKAEGHSHEEIAQIMGVKIEAIHQLSHRAKKRTSRNTLRTGTANV